MELMLRNGPLPERRQHANHAQAADMQPNETDNILQFPATTMGTQRETGLRRKWLLVLVFTGVVLLAVTVTAVAMHYTYGKGAKHASKGHQGTKAPTPNTYNRGAKNASKGHQGTKASTPKAKTEPRELWQLNGEDFYLVWQSNGADCDTAKRFCAKRNASLALMDQNNVHSVKKMSKGKKLWVLEEELEGSGSENSQAPDAGDAACTLLHAASTNDSTGDGWICMKGR
ncbi:uncharacterized protein LOC134079516 [Sardina pilchardus]|uniref:uncharacterized protein LOC134079516 n=1 Tax=Sardina pilchardus TaxID=27697 RepID=UPI002E1078A4